ncbi:MAG TPA: hypothetical protein VF407_15155, partial [Polyangiaceae bacterium]
MSPRHFEELAREIKGAQDETLAQRANDVERTEAAKERLRAARTKKVSSPPSWGALAIAAAFVLGIALGAFYWPKGQSALAFQIDDAPGTVGGFIRASADAP